MSPTSVIHLTGLYREVRACPVLDTGRGMGIYQTGRQMGKTTQAIIINEKDNVGTALKGLNAGVEVSVEFEGRLQKLKLLSDIPMGHKFALKDMEEGEAVIKYGEPIGQSKARIKRGEHVHVHNVASQKL
jgi:altronate dehydratase small subunit